METFKKVLRIVGAIVGGGVALFGLTGFIAGEYVLAAVITAIGGVLLFFSLHRSPAARAEAQIRKQARRSERFAAAEQARADAAQRARRASEDRQRQEERLRQQRAAEQAAWHEHVMRQQQAEQTRQQAAPGPQPQQPAEPVYKSTRDLRDERRAAAREQGVACCPYCGSTSLTANKKGYGIGKGVIGAAVAGPFGLAAGNIGRQKVLVTCLNCGRQFRPGKGRV